MFRRLLIATCAVFLVGILALPPEAAEAARRKRAPAAKRAAKKPAKKPVASSSSTTESGPNEPAPAAAPPADTPVSPVSPGGVAVKSDGKGKLKSYDFTAMSIEGKVLQPQIMYLLGRIKVELEKNDLEKRSFIPELVRSVDEGGI